MRVLCGMAERAPAAIEDSSARRTLEFLKALLRDFHPRDFRVQLWDGTSWDPEAYQFCRFTWKINSPSAIAAVILSHNRQLTLAEQYVSGNFDIEGDIEGIFLLADYLIHHEWSTAEKLALAAKGLRLEAQQKLSQHAGGAQIRGNPHTRVRDRQAIRYHYDISNEFYALWLDRNMVYSCAYFDELEDDLDAAQEKKLDEICRKLRLKAGERLLDIGCGWGGLVIHAARKYGVHALGISLSEPQIEFATARVQALGISDRCSARLLDYRDVPETDPFDKLVSIGMVEHVGALQLSTYFAKAFPLLRRGGLFLVSGISTAANQPSPSQPTFTELHVFPDGELVTISSLLENAERAGFEVRDVESLREHYALTTSQWLRRLEARADEAERIVGSATYRTWRLYLAGSTYYFQKAWLNVYQTLLMKIGPGNDGLLPISQS